MRADSGNEVFVAGEENAVVRVLASSVEQAALRYNPIVLCGPAGVGKSAIARALAARRQAALALNQIIETTGIDLARSLAHAALVHAAEEFRLRHQRCDVLVVDDCQALGGRLVAQQFLASTIDALVRRGSLVLVTLPQSPLLTRKLIPALTSRLMGGLVTTIAPPGFEARCELVRRESQKARLRLSQAEIQRLAGPAGRDAGRHLSAGKLRAAVMRLAANQKTGRIQTAAEPEAVQLEPLKIEPVDEKAVCRQTCHVVARHFGVTVSEIRGKSRRKSIAEARALAMYVSKRLTAASFEKIGKQFGGRDHTTVLHVCRKIEAAAEVDLVLGRLIDELARQAAASADV